MPSSFVNHFKVGARIGAVRSAHGKEKLESNPAPDQLRQQMWIMELPMKNLLSRFLKDNSGATAIEYGLIAAGISVAIIAVVNGLGTSLNAKFTSISTQLK